MGEMNRGSGQGRHDSVRAAADLYEEAASLLNAFFARHTSPYCGDCLAFHRDCSAGDPIAHHTLVSGVFPGCCQEGVADDSRIPFAQGEKLPLRLVEELAARRPPRPEGPSASYTVRNTLDGKLHEGRGCVWMGGMGCTLGSRKSPLCLAYLCPRLLEVLSACLGRELREDFCGFAAALSAIGRGAEGGPEALEEAGRAVARLRGGLRSVEEELAKR